MSKKKNTFFAAACLIAGGFVLGTGVVYADTDTEAEVNLRLASIQGLVHLGASSVYPDLVRSLVNDPSPAVRAVAAKGLGDLNIKESIPDLQTRIDGIVEVGNTEETDAQAIAAIREALVKLGGAIPGLIPLNDMELGDGQITSGWQFYIKGTPIELETGETVGTLLKSRRLEWEKAGKLGEIVVGTTTGEGSGRHAGYGIYDEGGDYLQKQVMARYVDDAGMLKIRVDLTQEKIQWPEHLRGTTSMPSGQKIYACVYEYQNEKVQESIVEVTEHRSKKEVVAGESEVSVYLDRKRPLVEEIEAIVKLPASDEPGTEAEFVHRRDMKGNLLWTAAAIKSRKETYLSVVTVYLAMLNLPQGGESILPVNGGVDEIRKTGEVGIGYTSPQAAVEIFRGEAFWGFDVNGMLAKREGTDPLSKEGRQYQSAFRGGQMWFTIHDKNGQPIRVRLERRPVRQANAGPVLPGEQAQTKQTGWEWGFHVKDGNNQRQWVGLSDGANPKKTEIAASADQGRGNRPSSPHPELGERIEIPEPVKVGNQTYQMRMNWDGQGYQIEKNTNFRRVGVETPNWQEMPVELEMASLETVTHAYLTQALEEKESPSDQPKGSEDGKNTAEEQALLDQEIEQARKRLRLAAASGEQAVIKYLEGLKQLLLNQNIADSDKIQLLKQILLSYAVLTNDKAELERWRGILVMQLAELYNQGIPVFDLLVRLLISEFDDGLTVKMEILKILESFAGFFQPEATQIILNTITNAMQTYGERESDILMGQLLGYVLFWQGSFPSLYAILRSEPQLFDVVIQKWVNKNPEDTSRRTYSLAIQLLARSNPGILINNRASLQIVVADAVLRDDWSLFWGINDEGLFLGNLSNQLMSAEWNSFFEELRGTYGSALSAIIEARNMGIRWFRIPNEDLSEIINNRKRVGEHDARPLVVIIYPVSDYNAALGAENARTNIHNLIQNGYRVIYYEVATEDEFKNSLLEATHGDATPAEGIIIGGHGTQNSIAFGSLKNDQMELNITDTGIAHSVQPCLAKGGWVVLESCSSGEGRESGDNTANFVRNEMFPQAQAQGIWSLTRPLGGTLLKFNEATNRVEGVDLEKSKHKEEDYYKAFEQAFPGVDPAEIDLELYIQQMEILGMTPEQYFNQHHEEIENEINHRRPPGERVA